MVGFDLGDGRCLMCMARPEFGSSHRKITDRIEHLSQIKRLLGKKFSDLELQSELGFLPFRVIEGPNGYPLIHCRCMGEDRAYRPIDILAMLISHLVAKAKIPQRYCDFPCCIAVPLYFTDQQRKDMLEAAKVAGLQSVSLLDETTAMVLGCENSHYLESNPTMRTVAFVNIGYASMQICFAQFEMTSGPEIETLVDASAGPWPFKEAKKMISLGLRCSDPIRKNWPDLSTRVMKEIKLILEVTSTSPSDAVSLFSRLLHL